MKNDDSTDLLAREIHQAEQAVANAQQQRDMWARKLEVEMARLDGLKKAAELRPQPPQRPHLSDRRGGRQPGAISQKWRHILLLMTVHHPVGANEEQIVEVARKVGLANMRPKDVRTRMEQYETQGYVKKANLLRGVLSPWQITEKAAQRFNIETKQEFTAVEVETKPEASADLDEKIPF